MPGLKDHLQRVRALVPARRIPGMVERRLDVLWADEAYRATQEAQMRHLLEFTDRAPEIPELARAFAAKAMLRKWMRWHPKGILRQRVEGIEWLTTKRDASRPMILSFMHHNHYEGMISSLHRAGAPPLQIVVLDDVLHGEVTAEMRQHIKLVQTGGSALSSAVGTAGIIDALKPGAIVAIASDVPSRTEVEFLGRRVRGASGAPRIAKTTDSVMVPVTAVRDDEESFHLQVHPPLDPREYDDPSDLLADLLRIHGEAVLAWPEVFDMPISRFGAIDGDA